MTRTTPKKADELLRLGARELDYEVARKVFGATVQDVPIVPRTCDMNKYFTDEAAEQIRRTYPRGTAPTPVPMFSSNIANVEKITRRLRVRGLIEPFLEALRESACNEGYVRVEKWLLFEACLPYVVCQAALKAAAKAVPK